MTTPKISRRRFLRDSTTTTLSLTALLTARAHAAKTVEQANPISTRPAPQTGKRAVVIGGGVGGMTAAHELIERGFEIGRAHV